MDLLYIILGIFFGIGLGYFLAKKLFSQPTTGPAKTRGCQRISHSEHDS